MTIGAMNVVLAGQQSLNCGRPIDVAPINPMAINAATPPNGSAVLRGTCFDATGGS